MPIAPMPRLTGAPQVPAADLLELKRSVLQWCVDNPERLFTMLCTEQGAGPEAGQVPNVLAQYGED
jgi:hypothetical protein